MFSKFSSLSGSCGSGKAFGKHGAGAPAMRPSYFRDVTKKLRSVERLRSLSEEEVEGMVEELTEEERLWSVYFSGMVLDPAREHIERKLDGEEGNVSPGDDKSHKAGVLIKLQCKKVCGSGQYGVQSFTSSLLKHYGPIHASVLVGGVIVLEWETSGLVIPTGKTLPLASESVRSAHALESVASKVSTGTEGSIPLPEQHVTPEEEILQEFETTLAKKEVIDKLVGVIVKYNKSYLYHPIFRNCQKFVSDCLVALGRHIPPKLEGELGDYMKEVKKGRKRRMDFESHADLDMYVGGVLESAKTSLLEKEYLLTQYFLFHVTSMTECEKLERWMCRVEGCRMAHLEQSVDFKSTIAYRMSLSEQ